MQKALLVNENSMFNIGVSEIIRNVANGIEMDIALKEGEMEVMLEEGQYQILLYGLPIVAQVDLDRLSCMVHRHPGMHVVLLFEPKGFFPVQKIYDSGIQCILDKNADMAEFGEAIQAIKNKGFYINSNLLLTMLGGRSVSDTGPLDLLTNRENTVVDLLLEGRCNKEICFLLSLRPSTVSTFKKALYRKLGISNLLELHGLKRQGIAI